jgi:transcriptional regulator with XRE-family HTH domain
MDDLDFKTADEIQDILGQQIKALRISKDMGQRTTSEKAGISEKALRNLEAGRGSTVETLVRVLKALDSLDGIDRLAPGITVSPVAMLRQMRRRQRVRKPQS